MTAARRGTGPARQVLRNRRADPHSSWRIHPLESEAGRWARAERLTEIDGFGHPRTYRGVPLARRPVKVPAFEVRPEARHALRWPVRRWRRARLKRRPCIPRLQLRSSANHLPRWDQEPEGSRDRIVRHWSVRADRLYFGAVIHQSLDRVNGAELNSALVVRA